MELKSRGKLHFGRGISLKDFSGSWFEDPTTKKIVARISSINWKPDDVYCKNDGYWGCCWEANVLDFCEDDKRDIVYKFRNFVDLTGHYKDLGYNFIDARY